MLVKELKDFPGYGVSEDGTVWSQKQRGRGVITSVKWRPLKGTSKSNRERYILVSLKNRSGNYVKKSVHRLVYETWVGEIGIGLQINHLDGDPTNNSLDNLEVVNQVANMQHAKRLGLLATNENGRHRGGERLSHSQILVIQAARGKVSVQHLMNAFGVTVNVIRAAFKK